MTEDVTVRGSSARSSGFKSQDAIEVHSRTLQTLIQSKLYLSSLLYSAQQTETETARLRLHQCKKT